jgi:hypothetical protein
MQPIATQRVKLFNNLMAMMEKQQLTFPRVDREAKSLRPFAKGPKQAHQPAQRQSEQA